MIVRIHRFIINAYPNEDHPKYHRWQKATLVVFVADQNPFNAEQKALDELKKRYWIPESFELRDTLIRNAVLAEGGDVWNAYLQAEKDGLFLIEFLDSIPMHEKSDEIWGTGPRLTEQFIDNLIVDSGGHRVTAEEAGNFLEKNADYVLGKYVLELKHLECEGLSVKTRQEKIAKLFQRNLPKGSLNQIDPYNLSEQDFEEYWEIIGVPIQKRIKAASKQVKATLARLNKEEYEGGIIILNTGYLSVPHDFLVTMAERYAAKDTSSIKKVIVISSWTITNGFDTAVYYGFHPNDPTCNDLCKLADTFWSTVEVFMTKMVTGELDLDSGMQEPMSPIHFDYEGAVFTFGVPHLESSFNRNNKDE